MAICRFFQIPSLISSIPSGSDLYGCSYSFTAQILNLYPFPRLPIPNPLLLLLLLLQLIWCCLRNFFLPRLKQRNRWLTGFGANHLGARGVVKLISWNCRGVDSSKLQYLARLMASTKAQAPESAWQHDMYSDVPAGRGGSGRVSAIETGTKLFITNLEFGVSTEDVKELFSELGDLKRCSIHYDRSGRSKGTAEVIFARRGDAVAAMKKYNNVQLDGKPMKIEILGTNTPTAAAALPANNGSYPRNAAQSAPWAASAGLQQNRPRIRGGRGRGGGGGGGGAVGGSSGSGGRRGKERSKPRSAEELDAELEKYHADAMQT